MATYPSAFHAVKSRVGELVTDRMVRNACRHCGHRWRERKLDPMTTVHLLLLQLLAGVALVRLDRVAQLGVSAAAACKARARLPLAVWQRLAEWTGRACRSSGRVATYKGSRVLIGDGTTLTTPDTPALAAKYGKASNQHRRAGAGYPVTKLLGLLDAATGTIAKVIDLPHARGEQTVLTRMLRFLRKGDLLLGDRGLVSFAHLARFWAAGVHSLARLPRAVVVHGRGKGSRRRARRLGKQDMLVRWGKPKQHKLKWLSRWSWRRLPASLELRQVAFQIHRKGHRSTWVWVITTLTDPVKYPAQSLAELYGKRWGIELAFRDLKTSLRMGHLTARTVGGVKKQVLAFVILHNLVRRVMRDAAKRQGVRPDRISFADAMTVLLWLPPGAPIPELTVNPRRRRRSEPRARKHAGYRFPTMTRPRSELQRPPATAAIGKAARLS